MDLSLCLIAALSRNGVIGRDNSLPWHLPEDLHFFKNVTYGMPVLMGRKTFESMGQRLLPGRWTLVLSRQPQYAAEHINVVHSLEEAQKLVVSKKYRQLFIIGGAELYRATIKLASVMYLTRVEADLQGDAYFPAFSEAEWELQWNFHYSADEKNKYASSFQRWRLKKSNASVDC